MNWLGKRLAVVGDACLWAFSFVLFCKVLAKIFGVSILFAAWQ